MQQPLLLGRLQKGESNQAERGSVGEARIYGLSCQRESIYRMKKEAEMIMNKQKV